MSNLTRDGDNKDLADLEKGRFAGEDELFRHLAENSVTGIWIHENYIIRYANERYAKLLGRSVDEIVGTSVWDNIPEEEKGLFKKRKLFHDIGIDTNEHYEVQMLHQNGSLRWMEVFSSEFNYDGKKYRMGNMVDITDRKTVERELQEAHQKLEQVSRAKTEFLANMSHELRTPLNMINGGAEIMEKEMFGPLGGPKYLEYARDIGVSGQLLLDLINDILDISRVDLGSLEIRPETISVPQILESCRRMIVDRTVKQGLTLELAPCDPALFLAADDTRVKQIILNLLTNSVKFTPEGGEISLAARLNPMGEIEIVVADTGIGMEEEHINMVRERFVQIENVMTRSQDGAGIGLSLVQDLVDLHEGVMDIESKPGKGTKVTIRFPAERTVQGQIVE